MFDQLPHQGGAVLPDAVTRIDIVVSLLEQGWLQKGWKQGTTLCGGQAILEAYGFVNVRDEQKWAQLDAIPLSLIVCAAIRSHHGAQGESASSAIIVAFNDYGRRSKAEVLQVFATARRWILEGSTGLDKLNVGKRGRKRLNKRLLVLHQQVPATVT